MNVVMMHSIGNNESAWSQRWLSISVNHFENFCRYLVKNNYESLFLDDWYRLQDSPELIHDKQIVLTLDDGYLDNWVYAFPLLKKYKLKATIFINPEFVDKGEIKRLNSEDVLKNKVNKDKLKTLGFLNWEEIKYMNTTDFIDIQSHSMTHNYYFKSDKIIDFYRGQDEYHWLDWIINSDQKPYWLNKDLSKSIPYGYPIFEFGRALGLRRFNPSNTFIHSYLSEYEKYRTSPTNIVEEKLEIFSQKFKRNNLNFGDFESEEEQKARYTYELLESKNIIEKKLMKETNFLCWPGGGYNDLSINISKSVGYKASTVASSDQSSTFNNKSKYKRIKRFGLGSFTFINGNFIYNTEKNHLVHLYKSKCGDFVYDNIMRLKKIKNFIKEKLFFL